MAVAPSGTCAWRRLLTGIRRPPPREHMEDAVGDVVVGDQVDPMTAAIASRVMSSCDARARRTTTASDRLSARRMAS